VIGVIELFGSISSFENESVRKSVAPKGSIKVIEILNPFDPNDHQSRFAEYRAGMKVGELVSPLMNPDVTVVSVSGAIIPHEQWSSHEIQAHDTVVICVVPAGGGKDSSTKQILRLVAIIVISIYAPAWGTALAGGAGTAANIYTAAIIIGASLIITALTPKPKFNTGGSMESSPTYGIDGAKNTSEEGVPVPVCFGPYRTAGNLVAIHVENLSRYQALYMLVDAGEGPIAGITDILINDQPLANYRDVEVEIRTGTYNQIPIPWFAQSQTAINKQLTIGQGFSFHTGTNPIDRFRLDMVCPQGLVEYDDRGLGRPRSVDLMIDYRQVGAADWIELRDLGTVTGTEPRYVYYDQEYNADLNSYFPIEVEREELFANDHVENDAIIRDWPVQMVVGYVRYMNTTTAGNRIVGSSTSPVRWSILSPNLTLGVYEVRVRRVTAQGTPPSVFDQVVWSDFVEIVNDPVAYRYTALLGVKIRLDDQISSIPSITFRNHGIIVPVLRDGTWVFEPTRNPAWIVYNAFTNNRWGGGYTADRMDLPQFIEWAAYCESVGLTWQGNFDQRGSLWDQMESVYRAGHAKPVTKGTRFSVAIEKPAEPSMMFNSTNILRDSFEQSWIGLSGRANEIEATYFDEEDEYRPHTIKLYDESIPVDVPAANAPITLYGVTTLARAVEESVFLLKQNRYFTSSISFRAYIDSIACRVGDVILVQHDQPNWSEGGRLEAGSTTAIINLDRPVTIGSDVHSVLVHYPTRQVFAGTITGILGNQLTLSGYAGQLAHRILVGSRDLHIAGTWASGVYVDDATGLAVGNAFTLHKNDVIETRTVANTPGTYTQLTLANALPEAPAQYSMFMVGLNSQVTKEWRVISIEGDGDLVRTIRCMNYDERIYDWTTTSMPVPVGVYTRFVPHVVGLSASESRALIGRTYRPVVDLSWALPPDFTEYDGADIYVAQGEAPYQLVGTVRGSTTYFQYTGGEVGDQLQFQIVTRALRNRFSIKSTAPTTTITLVGDALAPAVPTGVILDVSAIGLLLSWGNPGDADFLGLQVRRSLTSNFNDSSLIYTTEANQVSWLDASANDPTQPYYYWVRAIDYSGNGSAWVQPSPAFASPLASVGGADAVTAYLTNESHVVPADSSGTVGSGGFTDARGEFRVYEGVLEVTSSASFTVVSSNGCTGSINATTGIYQVTAMTADVASITYRALYNGVTIDKVFSLAKSRSGQDGTGANASLVNLTASAFTFTYDASSGSPVALPSIQNIALTANRQNIAEAVTWTCFDEAGALISPTLLTGVSGDIATLTVASFGSRNRVRIRATAGSYYDEVTIVRLESGADGDDGEPGQDAITGYLTNDSHVLAADATGAVASFATASGTFRVFDGLTEVTGSATFAVTASAGLTGAIGANTGVYSISAMSADLGTLTLRATYNGVQIARVFTVAKARQGVSASALTLTATAQSFHFDTANAASPTAQTITLTADVQNISGTVAWTATRFNAAGTSLGAATLTGTGNNRTLTVANFGAAAYCTVVATVGTFTDRVTIVRLQDGAAGPGGTPALVGYLTNEAHTIATDAAGNGGNFTGAGGTFRVFSGLTDVTTSCTFVATATGCTGTVGAATGVYSVTAMSADNATLSITATYQGTPITKVFSLAKSKSGRVIVGYLTNESHTVPAANDGTVPSWVGAGGTFRVFDNLSDVTTSAAFSVVAGSATGGLAVTIDASGVYAATAMTADTGTVTLQAVYGGVTVTKIFSVTKGRAGADGSDGASGTALFLTATRETFTYAGSGAALPASQTITFTAIVQNMTGTPTWTATLFNASNTSIGTVTLGGSGLTRTLTVAQFSTAIYAVVRITLGGLADQITVVRLQDGAQGDAGAPGAAAISGYLTNETHVLPARQDGTVLNYTGATGTFRIYEGLVERTGGTGVVYSIQSNPQALTATINAAGVYTVTGGFDPNETTGTLVLRAVIGGSTTIDKVFTLSKSRDGYGTATFTPRGSCVVNGNTFSKPTGTSAWDSDVCSNESFASCYVSAKPGQTNAYVMFGFSPNPNSQSPSAQAVYNDLVYPWYFLPDGTCTIYGYGGSFAYTVNTTLSIHYDGQKLRYFHNRQLVATIDYAGAIMYFDSAFASPGGVIREVQFGYAAPTGVLAHLNTINATHIEVASITSAHISQLAVQSAHIENLTIGTNKIANNGVTTMAALKQAYGAVAASSSEFTVISYTFVAMGAPVVLLAQLASTAGVDNPWSTLSNFPICHVYRNGSLLRRQSIGGGSGAVPTIVYVDQPPPGLTTYALNVVGLNTSFHLSPAVEWAVLEVKK
jgi:predicted phage tail protein